MKIAGPGFTRLAFGAKKSSLAASARPPVRAEARSARWVKSGVLSSPPRVGSSLECNMLVQSAYGKSRVRIVQVRRRGDRHDLHDRTVAIQFKGHYDESYTDGDNSACCRPTR
jgi:hypothetical protein